MSLSLTRDQVALFRSLSADRQRRLIGGLSSAELLAMDVAFEVYAHDDQWPPEHEG